MLASTSPNLLSAVLPTFAPCYCNIDYGNLFDILEPYIKDVAEGGNVTDVENLIGAPFSALSVAGFALQTAKTCLSGYCTAAWSNWPSWRCHSWPPRAPQSASEGLGLPSALVGRGPASQMTQRGRGPSARGRPS